MSQAAILALANGQVFHGQSIGAVGSTVGELIFNTSMSGYQEIITDPSYARQIITFTYPHIGNVGVNTQDVEANNIYSAGIVIRHLPLLHSNFRATQSLPSYLLEKGMVAISEIDTRALTHIIRDQGAQGACIMAGDIDTAHALEQAKAFTGLQGLDLAKEVSTKQTYYWNETVYKGQKPCAKYKVAVYDFGVKQNILRLLVDRGCELTVVNAKTPVTQVLALKPDGVFLANGPGDPAACHYAIEAINVLLDKNIPVFGICLGFQLLALALGAKTIKMKFGHHGANHPVKSLVDNRVLISSQNHGFAVDEASLPETLQVTHRSLFDNSLQGIRHKTKRAFGFQGHPEASPGPHDVIELFDEFIKLMQYEFS